MAIQTGPDYFIGHLGGRVGRKLPNGIRVVQSYTPKIRNNHLPDQTANRDRMSIATHLASRLGSVMDAAKPISGYDCYAHNKLVGKIKTWLDSSDCVGIFPAELPLVAEPGIEVQLTSFHLTRETKRVTLHTELAPDQAARLCRCAFSVVAYNETRNQWQSFSPMKDNLTDVTLTLPEQWESEEVHIAGYILPSFYADNDHNVPILWGQIFCTFLVPESK